MQRKKAEAERPSTLKMVVSSASTFPTSSSFISTLCYCFNDSSLHKIWLHSRSRYNDHPEKMKEDNDEEWSFEEAVALLNQRDYHSSHDAFEESRNQNQSWLTDDDRFRRYVFDDGSIRQMLSILV